MSTARFDGVHSLQHELERLGGHPHVPAKGMVEHGDQEKQEGDHPGRPRAGRRRAPAAAPAAAAGHDPDDLDDEEKQLHDALQ